jgi:hypothetical protein
VRVLQATFELAILVPAHLSVLSNMTATTTSISHPSSCPDLPPHLSSCPDLPPHLLSPEEPDGGWTLFSFSPTPRMSTYLLCFVIGEYVATSAKVDPVTSCLVIIMLWTRIRLGSYIFRVFIVDCSHPIPVQTLPAIPVAFRKDDRERERGLS